MLACKSSYNYRRLHKHLVPYAAVREAAHLWKRAVEVLKTENRAAEEFKLSEVVGQYLREIVCGSPFALSEHSSDLVARLGNPASWNLIQRGSGPLIKAQEVLMNRNLNYEIFRGQSASRVARVQV